MQSAMLAFVLSSLVAAAAPAYPDSCPQSDARVLVGAVLNPPDSIHPTNRRARFLLDVGSDGRVRRAAMTESSGDATFDADALAAAKQMTFVPPQEACLSPSSVAPESFDVPLLALARPAPGGSGPPVLPTSAPAADLTICAAPFVELTGLDVPDKRPAPGTVAIDVRLDASAHVVGAQLAHSGGNAQTDAAALAMARGGEYAFAPQPGCPPKPTTYQLELTYH
jgi:TonB family protein